MLERNYPRTHTHANIAESWAIDGKRDHWHGKSVVGVLGKAKVKTKKRKGGNKNNVRWWSHQQHVKDGNLYTYTRRTVKHKHIYQSDIRQDVVIMKKLDFRLQNRLAKETKSNVVARVEDKFGQKNCASLRQWICRRRSGPLTSRCR